MASTLPLSAMQGDLARIKAFLPGFTFFQEQLFLGLFHVVPMINLHAHSGQPEYRPYSQKKNQEELPFKEEKSKIKWKHFQSAYWQF